MSAVFLDTVGLLALWDADDQWHNLASTAFDRIVSARQVVVTTNFVLLECANAAARRPYRKDLIDIRDELLRAGGLIDPTSNDVQAAWAEYRQGIASGPGVVDLVSFATMRRLQIRDAFTNDRHFRAAGFQTLF